MGAWGYGILQNDTAQDGLGEIADGIEESIAEWTKGSEKNAAQLGAAVGLLLRFSPYSFNVDSPFPKTLAAILTVNQPYFDRLPGLAGDVLNRVLSGEGEALAGRVGTMPTALDTAFHGDEEPRTFPTQKEFAHYEPDLFLHPKAVLWLRELAKQLVAEVDEGLEDDDVVYDLAREGEFMGAFAVLCLLGPTIVKPSHFARWKKRIHKVMDALKPTGDETEDEFMEKYYRLLDTAFDYVLNPATENTSGDKEEMPDAPKFDVQTAHRYFAAHYFNTCWQLIRKFDRSDEEDARMVRLALTSLHHWSEWEGVTDTNFSIGYWQVARVYALVGQAQEARWYAEQGRDISRSLAPFYRAYALEALARTEAVARNADAASRYVAEATALSSEISDPEERETLLQDLATISSIAVPE